LENDKPWKVGNGCGGDENIHTINVGAKKKASIIELGK
jgi:hypothetical protein